MKITIESTDRIVTARLPGGMDEVPARVWEGSTESGIPVQCLVTRICAPASENLEQFQKELQECRPPSAVQTFPLRMIL